ncbi:MAG: glycoside hydrolase family 20 protein [Bacteroidota bacterium]
MRQLTILVSFFLSFCLCAQQQVNIIPKPASLKIYTEKFVITEKTQIRSMSRNTGLPDYLKKMLQDRLQLSLRVSPSLHPEKGKTYIALHGLKGKNSMSYEEDYYELRVSKDGISIGSMSDTGLFYGIQTLLQLIEESAISRKQAETNFKPEIPYLVITDYPRFTYRGMHLDVGRHFFPVDFIKRYIDYLAYHKLNIFHWHLTEDQGWRIEIKKYPKLTSVGGWRNGTIIGRYPGTGNDGIKYGGYYTQEQIKEIVKYAADRYINVIPEIEMPGHSSAAIAAYPELSCFPNEPTIKYFPKQCTWHGDSSGKQVQQTWGVFDDVFCAGQERTFKFLEDVLDEVLPLFPSKYVHVGGDECPKENWKRCPHCQKRIKENNLKDEHELQSYFIQRMEKYLNSKGRTLIGWDEILEGGLAHNAVVMSWRGEKGGIEAAQQNHDVIMTPGNPVYFDHTQSENEDSVTIGGFNPLEKVYAYEPVPKELSADEAKYVLGAQANMWTEYMKNTKKVEYMLFPRIGALSEVLWSPKENKNWDDFQKRLLVQFKRYDKWKVNYSKAYFDLKSFVSPGENDIGVNWNYSSLVKNVTYSITYKKKAETLDTIPLYDPTDINRVVKYKIIKPGDAVEINRQIIPEKGYYPIQHSGTYTISGHRLIMRDTHEVPESKPFTSITQTFSFNAATGKNIRLINEASKNYPGDGAFTLVNGVINEKGFARTKEFLGFNGTDCEAVIDLGESTEISFVVVNCLDRRSSWIWRPQSAEVFGSGDGQKWYPLKSTDNFEENKNGTGNGMMSMSFRKTFARYVKVLVKNWGAIPEGNPGAGNKAWLFVDEIEVN